MITDEKRREVAARLRNFNQLRDVFRESNVCAFCDVLGVGYMDWEHICARLADLIDRPTCHISETDHEFEDSVRCDMCRTTFNRPWEPFKYCPNCGAEVEDEV